MLGCTHWVIDSGGNVFTDSAHTCRPESIGVGVELYSLCRCSGRIPFCGNLFLVESISQFKFSHTFSTLLLLSWLLLLAIVNSFEHFVLEWGIMMDSIEA